MLLSQITVRPAQYQNRSRPYSEQTVKGIMAEGIDLAKFDSLPIIASGKGVYCVAGDGHSRYEAVRRLAEAGRLPDTWAIDGHSGEWDIPARRVSAQEAQRLAWTANFSRDNFTPSEEARVFQSMLDSGLSVDRVAQMTHRSATYISRALPLNTLCRDIREAIGRSAAAGGIDVLTGQVLAAGFARYGIDVTRQQDLWHRCLKHAMLNFQSAKKFIDSIGSRFAEKSSGDFLFQMPVNAATVLEEARIRMGGYRSARTGIAMLIKAMEAGGLEHYPALAKWLTKQGKQAVAELGQRLTEDGEILAAMVAA